MKKKMDYNIYNKTEFHQYDLEINNIYSEFCKGIDQTNIPDEGEKSKTYFKNLIKENFSIQLQIRGMNFEDPNAKLVKFETPFYLFALETSLCFKNKSSIEFFLDFQIASSNGNGAGIISMLQHFINPSLENCPFDNSERTRIIQRYVKAFKAREERKKKSSQIKSGPQSQTKKDKVSLPTPDNLVYKQPILCYNTENLELSSKTLKSISKWLFEKQHTYFENSFSDVFFKATECRWLQEDLTLLGLLLNSLKTKKYIKIMGGGSSKAIFKVSLNYFKKGDGSSFAKGGITNSIYKARKNDINRYLRIQKTVATQII